MSSLKKLLPLFIILFVLCIFSPANSSGNVNIYFFWGAGCPHCAKEKELLDFYKKTHPYINVVDFEVHGSSENGAALSKVAEALKVRVDGIPFTVIGDKTFIGYSEFVTPGEILDRIKFCHDNECPDLAGSVLINSGGDAADLQDDNFVESDEEPAAATTAPVRTTGMAAITGNASVEESDNKLMNIPILGEIDVLRFSLPIIAVVMGFLDGFNPCALWALLFLISLLLGMQNKKRMWILGSAFIVISAFVYFLFMAAWLNLILFIGFIIWVRFLIGGVALFGAFHNLKKYFQKKEVGCEVANTEKRQRIFMKIRQVVQQHSLPIALGGIILLAFAVNLVELICSAGLPAVFTQILAINDLELWQYYGYIILYIFFFMLDDLIVFVIAMATLHLTGITTKYTRFSKLAGGLLMLIIGLLLIFKPEWLMFG